ncbi:hypothetical protein ENBRE01_2580 [Enteropsectra breve]|nr:hypothetical protein ENBRE01_2580 [Enteropsectra breve]
MKVVAYLTAIGFIASQIYTEKQSSQSVSVKTQKRSFGKIRNNSSSKHSNRSAATKAKTKPKNAKRKQNKLKNTNKSSYNTEAMDEMTVTDDEVTVTENEVALQINEEPNSPTNENIVEPSQVEASNFEVLEDSSYFNEIEVSDISSTLCILKDNANVPETDGMEVYVNAANALVESFCFFCNTFTGPLPLSVAFIDGYIPYLTQGIVANFAMAYLDDLAESICKNKFNITVKNMIIGNMAKSMAKWRVSPNVISCIERSVLIEKSKNFGKKVCLN